MEVAHGLMETLKNACQALDEHGIPYCLIGGLAVGLLGKPRATEDIDLLILVEQDAREKVAAALRSRLTIVQDTNITRFKKATIWRVIIKDTFSGDAGIFVLDLLFADTPLYKTTVRNPVRIEIDGVQIPVARAEHLIKIKRLSGRPQDLLDADMLRDELRRHHD